MKRPHPTSIMHFTHIGHLPDVIAEGLLCDELALEGPLAHEIGNPRIKQNRRGVAVRVHPGGTVAAYAPFYFAPRSPMLFSLARQGLLEMHGGQDALIYLCTTVEHLRLLGLALVYTDRNAYYGYAKHTTDDAELDDLVDWDLMAAQVWRITLDEPDRMERRMAECLVHQSLPWEGILSIVVRSAARAGDVRAIIEGEDHQPRVHVESGWYY